MRRYDLRSFFLAASLNELFETPFRETAYYLLALSRHNPHLAPHNHTARHLLPLAFSSARPFLERSSSSPPLPFSGTTNIWLHAAILRAHSSPDLPLWLALSVAAAPVFILVGLEIHWKVLSATLRRAVSLPRCMLDVSTDLVHIARMQLGYYVPGEARAGASR
jgi:hypothetical protein